MDTINVGAHNGNLHAARNAADDEFYTEYERIENEVNEYLNFNKDVFKNKTVLCPCDDPEWSEFTKYFVRRFKKLGLKKLICTSYAKSVSNAERVTDYERNSQNFDEEKHSTHGKKFVMTKADIKTLNIDDLNWDYLEGDGDFRSNEVTALRDEADIIITNPPFSLFREFVDWILKGNKKQFLIIGNQNAITYKEIFPLIRNDVMWLGIHCGDMAFRVPQSSAPRETRFWIDETGQKWRSMGNICWYTNIPHHKRYDDSLGQKMTFDDNLRFNDKLIKTLKDKYGLNTYPKYDNYDAIEVPYVDAIPSDYDGVMGVPITFLNSYNPEQFEIVAFRKGDDGKDLVFTRERESSTVLSYPCTTSIAGMIKNAEGKISGKPTYARITIRRKLSQ